MLNLSEPLHSSHAEILTCQQSLQVISHCHQPHFDMEVKAGFVFFDRILRFLSKIAESAPFYILASVLVYFLSINVIF